MYAAATDSAPPTYCAPRLYARLFANPPGRLLKPYSPPNEKPRYVLLVYLTLLFRRNELSVLSLS